MKLTEEKGGKLILEICISTHGHKSKKSAYLGRIIDQKPEYITKSVCSSR
jgi:hypothetical protein